MSSDIKVTDAPLEQLHIEGINVTLCFAPEKNKEAEEQIYKLLAQSLILKLRV